ncbi:hypothetical protein, partial [Streptomyces sp. SPB78]|uniref:hypothetical protein n=1 Tax=Streptomyces sp. (strain SPB78) TaxID=591157 RepID=UPI001F37379E
MAAKRQGRVPVAAKRQGRVPVAAKRQGRVPVAAKRQGRVREESARPGQPPCGRGEFTTPRSGARRMGPFPRAEEG